MKIQVLRDFRDAHTLEMVKAGDRLEMTEARYSEATASLAKWADTLIDGKTGPFLKVCEEEKGKLAKTPPETEDTN